MVPVGAVHPSSKEPPLMPRWAWQVQEQAIPAQQMCWRDHGKAFVASTMGLLKSSCNSDRTSTPTQQ